MSKRSVLVVEEACPPELLAEVRAKCSNPTVVSSLAQARPRIDAGSFDLVVCGVHLPDGNWADVLSCLVRSGSDAEFILCAQNDDSRLRTELFGRGGTALMRPPYVLPEIPERRAAQSPIQEA